MFQLEPDWTAIGTKSSLEESIGNGFRIDGPGLYLSDTDTVLVMVSMPLASDADYPWKKMRPDDTIYSVHCWNCHLSETILGAGHIPIREGEEQIGRNRER